MEKDKYLHSNELPVCFHSGDLMNCRKLVLESIFAEAYFFFDKSIFAEAYPFKKIKKKEKKRKKESICVTLLGYM
jgi:hypothetical protein